MNEFTLRQAIEQKKTVKFRHDDDTFEREVEPHILYESLKGNLTLGGYVVHDGLQPLVIPKYRDFGVAAIKFPSVTKKSFVPQLGFDPRDKRYSRRVVCSVQ